MATAWFSKGQYILNQHRIKIAEGSGWDFNVPFVIVRGDDGCIVAATEIGDEPSEKKQFNDFERVALTSGRIFKYLLLHDGKVTAEGKAYAAETGTPATAHGILRTVDNYEMVIEAARQKQHNSPNLPVQSRRLNPKPFN